MNRHANHSWIAKSSAFPKALAAHAMPPSLVPGFDSSMRVIQLYIDAWGTKWDLDEPDQLRVADELLDTGITYFDTAWSPPIAAVEKLSAMFPDDSFGLTYCEPGNSFAGTATFNAGTSDDIPASDEEVTRIACEVFGYDEPDEPATP